MGILAPLPNIAPHVVKAVFICIEAANRTSEDPVVLVDAGDSKWNPVLRFLARVISCAARWRPLSSPRKNAGYLSGLFPRRGASLMIQADRDTPFRIGWQPVIQLRR